LFSFLVFPLFLTRVISFLDPLGVTSDIMF
jgi:hypothetical protein